MPKKCTIQDGEENKEDDNDGVDINEDQLFKISCLKI
jgi:hypothetical protein